MRGRGKFKKALKDKNRPKKGEKNRKEKNGERRRENMENIFKFLKKPFKFANGYISGKFCGNANITFRQIIKL